VVIRVASGVATTMRFETPKRDASAGCCARGREMDPVNLRTLRRLVKA